MNNTIGKANFKRFKRKPKPILNAKRFKDLSYDEKPNFRDNSLEAKSVSRDLDSEPNSVIAPLIESSQDLSTVKTSQCTPHDSLNVTVNSSVLSNKTTSTDIFKHKSVSNSITTPSINSYLTYTSAKNLTIPVSTGPVITTSEASVTCVPVTSSTVSTEESSVGLNDKTKLLSTETEVNDNLNSLDNKNSEIVKGNVDVDPLGGVRDKKLLSKNTLQNQKLSQILSNLDFTAPLIKITVLQLTDNGPKAITLPYRRRSDIRSALLQTSDNSDTLDHSAKVVNMLGEGGKERSLTISRQSGVSARKPVPCRKIPDLAKLRSKSCSTSYATSVLTPTSDNNITVSTLEDGDNKEDNLKVSDTSTRKSLSCRKKPDLAMLKSKAYDEHGNLNKNKLTLRDFIYFNPPHNPMRKDVVESYPKSCDIDHDSDSISSETDCASAVPLVKVSADGKIIVDPESINVCPYDKKLKKMKKRKIIREDEYSSRLKIRNHIRRQNKDTISSLFSLEESQKQCGKFWTLEETLKFYKVLNEFGSDFSIMIEAFPYRTRKQLKRKFLAEEKVRIKYIDLAMMRPDSIDFKALEEELKKKKQLKKSDNKNRKKLLTIGKEKEFEQRMEVDYKSLVKRRKLTLNSEINFENGVHRLGRTYNEKENEFRRQIKRMKFIYLEEKRRENKKYNKNFRECQDKKNNINSKKRHKKNRVKLKDKEDSDTESDVESLRFDIGNPSYKNNLFLEQQEVHDSFIQGIKDEDDFDLFLSISSKMHPNLGVDWRTWVRNKIIDQLLKKKDDCGAKRAANKMKTSLKEKENAAKLERSYRLFADPFDFTDPFVNYSNDNL